MEKYYLISGKALINVNFRESGNWYKPNEEFENEKISESQLHKFKRHFVIKSQSLCVEKKIVKQQEQDSLKKADINNNVLV